MKTKNIFRVLLMAVALVMGVNNIKADDDFLFYSESGTELQSGSTYGFPLGKFANAKVGDLLRVWGVPFDKPVEWNAGVTDHKIEIKDRVQATVFTKTTGFDETAEYYDFELDQAAIDGFNANEPAWYTYSGSIQGEWFRLYKVEIVSVGGDVEPSYSITVTESSNGSVAANKNRAKKDDIVTLSLSPAEDYELDELSVQTEGGTDVSTTKVDDNTYTFAMPEETVIVAASFKAIDYTLDTAKTLWENTEGKAVDWWNNRIEINTAWFRGASANDVLRIYGTGANGWQLQVQTYVNNNWQPIVTAIDASAISSGYVQIELSDDDLEALTAQKIAIVVGANFTVTEIKLIPVSELAPTYIINVDQEIAHGTVEANRTEAEATQVVTLTATPETGYSLQSYTVTAGETTVTVTDNQFEMPAANVNITASFVPNIYKVFYQVDGVTTTTAEVAYGAEIPAIDNPSKEGFKFSYWENLPQTMPAKDITVSAVFTPVYTLTLVYNQEQGVVVTTKTMDIEEYDQITVTVTPADGYEVESVSFTNSDGTTPTNWGTYIVQFGKFNVTCTVNFREVAAPVYNVNIGNVQNGSVTASASSAEAGTSITLTLTPNSGYEFESLSVIYNNGQTVTVTDNQFTMPADNVWINAVFTEIVIPTHTLTIANNVDDQTLTMTVAEGVDLASVLSAPAKEGYTFAGWNGLTEDGKMPTTEWTVTAEFTINSYRIIFIAGNEENETSYMFGEQISTPSVPTPEDGLVFSGWVGLPTTMPGHDVTVYGYFNAELAVSSNGYSTFCSKWPLHFTGREDIKAYIAKSKSENEVTLTQVIGDVAAGTGLVLVGNTGYATAQVQVVETGTDYQSINLLVGVLSTNVINSSNQYVLVEKENGVRFADTANKEAHVPAGKAYLETTASSRILTIHFEDGDVTGIGNTESEVQHVENVYNLRGQRVVNPKKGLYIINRKKVMIK